MVWQLRNYWGREVRLAVPDQECFARLDRLLPSPPGEKAISKLREGEGEGGDTALLIRHEGETFVLYQDQEKVASHTDWGALLERFEWAFQLELGSKAPHGVFVHSGVVALGDRALLLPACSYSGKSTMTHALVRLGATYFSDEFAVIDRDGLVHPYRRAMTIRRDSGRDRRISPSRFHRSPTLRCSIAVVVDCKYEKGARWEPEPLSRGEGLLSLFANTVSAQLSPLRDLAWLTTAMQDAQAYRTLRGDVRSVAPKLLELLQRS